MNTARVFSKISLLLAAILVFVVPYEAARNIDAQGILLIIAGLFAWLAILLKRDLFLKILDKKSLILLGLIILSALLSMAVNPHLGYDLLGAPLVRLGSLGLISCIGIGLLATQIKTKQLIPYLYAITCTVGVIAIPYNLYSFASIDRVGGVFAQADILAVFLASGLLLGLYLSIKYSKKRILLVFSQLGLLGMLILTQTRAAVFLAVVLAAAYMLIEIGPKVSKNTLIVLVLIASLVVVGAKVLPSRLTDAGFAKSSATYRLELQKAALRQTTMKPFFGYGLGNISDSLDCKYLRVTALKETCDKHYFFNSSHNIYLDRILSLGWIGGLAYLVFVVMAIYRGLRAVPEIRIMAFCALLISLYYMTNVLSLTLELLLWVLLLQCLRHNKS